MSRRLGYLKRDDELERLQQCSWDPNLFRIGTIGDGNCYFHAILKAVHPEYQETVRMSKKVELITKFRIGIAQKLQEASVFFLNTTLNEDGEEVTDMEDDSVAVEHLYTKIFQLDNDDRVEEHVRKLDLFDLDAFPMPRKPANKEPETAEEKEKSPKTTKEWKDYNQVVKERKEAIVQRFRRLEREEGRKHVVDFRPRLGGLAEELPLHATIFMVNNSFLLEGALTLKETGENGGGIYQSIDDIVREAATDKAWIGNNLAAAIPHIIGVNVAYFEVWNDKVVISILNTCPFDAHFILLNNCGSDENPDSSTHYETMGVLVKDINEDGKPTNYIQTVFRRDEEVDDPFVRKLHDVKMGKFQPPKPKSPKPKSPSSPSSSSSSSSSPASPRGARIAVPRQHDQGGLTEADLDKVRAKSPRVGYAAEFPSAATTYIPVDVYRKFYGREPLTIVQHVEPKQPPVGNAELMIPKNIIWLPDDMLDKAKPLPQATVIRRPITRPSSPKKVASPARPSSSEEEPATRRTVIRPRARIVIRPQQSSPRAASPSSSDSTPASPIKPRPLLRRP
jgi:hypothetical protein